MDVFKKIIDGEIPSKKIYEDDYCIAILDLNPFRKGHSLVISKECRATIEELDSTTLSHMINAASLISKKMRDALNADDTNVLINNGPAAGQEIPHVHMHVIPRFEKDGPLFGIEKQKYEDGEMELYREKLTLI